MVYFAYFNNKAANKTLRTFLLYRATRFALSEVVVVTDNAPRLTHMEGVIDELEVVGASY
ncbi:hypothetical protein PsorP6_010299 [Peronosclerospora sorghi]|uniref:Uncharacterized protein n=1 Tax=Peronosclerospora sorghi TaxID=230839 RepID=A0ACC0VXV3_9STRA|nr:hypothetical protein PsorP6_010299 [Peronosclerospora sorghi]